MADRQIMIIKESARESWLRDTSSVVSFIALIGIGIVLDSSAMQWVGAILGFIVILERSNRLFKSNRFTIEEARKRLDEIERGAR
jgi:hypothetical protein